MREVVFIKAFAGKKKDDVGRYDGQLASSLVKRKVAKYKTKKKK